MSWGPFDLTGRSAVVTGAAMGIGFGIASRFREAGADVVIADIDATAADRAIERLGEIAGAGRMVAVRADVSDPASGKAAITAAVDNFGRVDILVNNAGIYPVSMLADLTPELIKAGTLTGSGPEIIDRIRELEAAGVTNIALNVCGTDARELIREFGREVIDKY